MSTKHVLRAVENLAGLLGAKIQDGEQRGYYKLRWPKGRADFPQPEQKPLSILARLLHVAVAPTAVGGGGLSAQEAGELAGLETAPSLDNCSGWEQGIIEAALPKHLREALRRNRRRRSE